MGINQRTNQGGSIVSFIIVGVILAAGLIGGVYYLKQRGDQVRKEQAIAAADKQKASQTTTQSSGKSSGAGATGGTTNTSGSTGSTSSTSSGMPTTGPESIVFEAVGVYLLTATFMSYMLSRRDLKRYL